MTNENGTVTTLDPVTGAVVGSAVEVGPDADGISLSSDAVWAVALYGQTLVRIDPATSQVVTRVKTPGQASGVLAAGGSVWVSNYDRATVSRFDVARGRFVKSYRVGNSRGASPRQAARSGSRTSRAIRSRGSRARARAVGAIGAARRARRRRCRRH